MCHDAIGVMEKRCQNYPAAGQGSFCFFVTNQLYLGKNNF